VQVAERTGEKWIPGTIGQPVLSDVARPILASSRVRPKHPAHEARLRRWPAGELQAVITRDKSPAVQSTQEQVDGKTATKKISAWPW
jgi:hypothetical protein